jgi:hypothetical protein
MYAKKSIGESVYTLSDLHVGKNDIWCDLMVGEMISQLHVVIDISEVSTSPQHKVVLFLSNLPASEEKSIEVYIDDQLYFKANQPISVREAHLIDTMCFNPKAVKLTLKIGAIRLDHTRELNTVQHGEFLKIYLDEVKKTLGIQQQFKPFDLEDGMKYMTSIPGTVSDKVETVYLNLINLPGSLEDPIEIYFDTELIYRVETIILDNSRELTIHLPIPLAKMKLILKSNKITPIEANLMLAEHGCHLQISLAHGDFDVKQRIDGNFPSIEAVFRKERFRFYLCYCKASEDKPLVIKIDDAIVQSIKSITKDVTGVGTEITIPHDPDHRFSIQVIDNYHGISTNGSFKQANGNFIKIEILDNEILVFQQHDEYKFTYGGEDNRIVATPEKDTVRINY